MSVTIYHNPDCGTSRNTLAMIRQSGIEPTVIEYLKSPPSREKLVELIEAPRGHYPTSTVRGSCWLDRVTPLQNATELQPGSKQFAGRPSQRIRRDRQCDARVDGVGNSSDQTGKQSVPDRWTRRLDIPQVLLTEIPLRCPTPPSFAGI
jgi:hypothetical protein